MTENMSAAAIKKLRRPERYEDSLIFERKPFCWPRGKTLAVWIIPNVEAWTYDSPEGLATSPNIRNVVPDVINYAWREYGIGIGLWRIADVLESSRGSGDRSVEFFRVRYISESGGRNDKAKLGVHGARNYK